MSYDEEQSRKSRVVVETPTSRREVTQTDSVRNPDADRGGISGATVGVIVVVAIALLTVLVLFLMSGQQQTDNANNLAAQQQTQPPPTTIIQQPAQQQQPPVIIQQPAPAANQPPVIINQPAPTTGGGSASMSNDGAVQLAIDKKINDDPNFSSLGITATVLDGKVTLTGTVNSEAVKSRVDRMIRSIKGVKQVDNQIVVTG
jgi:osmotically-inducible protein OsmY